LQAGKPIGCRPDEYDGTDDKQIARDAERTVRRMTAVAMAEWTVSDPARQRGRGLPVEA
jgi:hypothetical protein